MEDKELKVLVFGLNGEYYATDILDVERILGYEEATEMPDVPKFVKGVINHQSKILPIISLSKKFSFLESDVSDQTKIIVVKNDNRKFGVIVDNVYEVTDVDNTSFEEAPPITTTISKKFIKGLIKQDSKIVILLNISNILSEEEEEQIF